MSLEQARLLFQQGVQAAKSGDKENARNLLQQSLRLDPNNDTAWLLLGSVARTQREKLACIRKALEVNPGNATAIKALEAMGIDPSRLTETSSPATSQPAPEPAIPPVSSPFTEIDDTADVSPFAEFEDQDDPGPTVDESGIPIPSAVAIRRAESLAEQIIAGYKEQSQLSRRIEWTQKTRGRAGEREIMLLRAQVGTALVVFLVTVIGLGAFIISNSPEAQLTLFGASATPIPPTATFTNTPTNTPGFTPTPSPTKTPAEVSSTPSPTFSLSVTPVAANPNVTPPPTALDLPESPGQAIFIAARSLNEGNPEEALEPLATAKAGLGSSFEPNPYYYEALIYLDVGNNDAALDVLTEAERRVDPLAGFVNRDDQIRFTPLVDLGFAQYHLEVARDAQESGNTGQFQEQIALLEERIENILIQDPGLADAYLVQAEAQRMQGDLVGALETVNAALEIPELLTNQNLIVAKGWLHLQLGNQLAASGDEVGAQANYDSAVYQGEWAVYLNPFNEPSHQLQIEAALALGDPGLAVIRSQGYLLYFQNSAEAFRRLGSARVAEGNNDLALIAYSSALNAEGGDDNIANVHISRAELYAQQRRYDLALEDLNAALERRDDLNTHARRLYVAYQAGDYDTTLDDINTLRGTAVITSDELNLMEARLIMDQGGNASEALTLLNQVSGAIGDDLRAVTDDYRAQAHFALGNLEDALNAINRALSLVETGSRRFLRGQIYQELGQRDDAIAEYEWVLTWNPVFAYPFADDARQNIESIYEQIAEEQAQATAAVITATAESEFATATAAAPITETAQANATATATAGIPLTETQDAVVTITAEAEIALTETQDAVATITATAEIALTATQDRIATLTATVERATETAAAVETSTAAAATRAAAGETAVVQTATAAAQATRDQATRTLQPEVTPEATPEPQPT